MTTSLHSRAKKHGLSQVIIYGSNTYNNPDTSTLFKCDVCNIQFSPNLTSGGRLPKGWYKCPNGCNSEVV